MTNHKIIPMDQGRFESAKGALVLAFMDDPLMEFFAPDREKREKISPWFWGAALSYGMRWGVVETDEAGMSAAIWMPPDGTTTPMHRLMRTSFVQFPFRLGLRGIWRFIGMAGATEKAHKRQVPGPHWYLLGLGVHPDLQGKGIGSALLEAGHRRADEDDVPCYLETATEADVAFYSKRGYEEGEGLAAGDLSAVTMIRRPASQRQAAGQDSAAEPGPGTQPVR